MSDPDLMQGVLAGLGPSTLWSSLPELREKLRREEVCHRKSADRTFTIRSFHRHMNQTALPTPYPLDLDLDHDKVREATLFLRAGARQAPVPGFCKGVKSSMKWRIIAFDCRLERRMIWW